MKFLFSWSMLALLVSSAHGQNKETRQDWFNLSPFNDGRIQGARVNRAYQLYGEGKEEIIVAVIDSGVSVYHKDLTGKFWINKGETKPNDGIDNDKNGYIDDVFGWNYLGNKKGMATFLPASTKKDMQVYVDGRISFGADITTEDQYFIIPGVDVSQPLVEGHVLKDTFEVTREYSRILGLQKKRMQKNKRLKRRDRKYLAKIKRAYTDTMSDFQVNGQFQLENFDLDSNPMSEIILQNHGPDKGMFGNNDIALGGRGVSHGTHVAGIIAAKRGNGIGIDGIATKVKIMPIRAVPDGDERDEVIAAAIRYAADNGARIANLSFGKNTSAFANLRSRKKNGKKLVDSAIRYARKKGMLIVVAAGNDLKEISKNNQFPNKKKKGRWGKHSNMIVVGASKQYLPDFVAPFTNYSKKLVDLFAPGYQIESTIGPHPYFSFANSTDIASGTSMAAPVVSGIAAYVWSHFPELNYKQIKKALLNVRHIEDNRVARYVLLRTGTKAIPPFSDLSKTAGVVDAVRAMIRAKEYAKKNRKWRKANR